MKLKRVKCRVCSFSEGKRCVVKDVKVAQNKPRYCSEFVHDMSKVTFKKKLKSEYIPYYMSSKKLYKKWLIEQKEKELSESMEDKVAALQSPDILNRFRSSASEN